MSYILDALRKSEQQRQRGMAPSLATAPLYAPPAATDEKPSGWKHVALAVVLLTAGVAIGWLRPWQATPPAAAPAKVALPETAPIGATLPTTPPPAPAALETKATPPAPPAPEATALPATPVTKRETASTPDRPPAGETARSALQALPALTITAHAHSADPKERVVIINRKPVREGEQAAPGVTVERITEDGVIFNVHGRRVARGLN